jgi:hypothetical protein
MDVGEPVPNAGATVEGSMRWRALMTGGACLGLSTAMIGCGLVVSLDGLSGGSADSGASGAEAGGGGGADGGSSDSKPGGEGSTPDAGGLDAAGADAEGGASDTGPTDAGAATETGSEAAADAAHDAVDEPPPVGSITFVQIAASSPTGSLVTVSAKLLQAQSAGDLVVVAIGTEDATSSVATVTDSSGNAYALALGPTRLGVDLSQSIYYAKNVNAAAGGANSVTVTFVEPANVPDLRVLEYSGLDPAAPLDGTASGTGNSAGPATTTAVTTKTARELLFAAGMTSDAYAGAGTGFSERLITNDGDVVEDRVVAATGSYSATAPLNISAEWLLQLVTFR